MFSYLSDLQAGGGIMKMVIFLSALAVFAVAGYFLVKSIDRFFTLETSSPEKNTGQRNVTVRIVCENPVMLPYVSEKIERQGGHRGDVSFSFYTGGREEIFDSMGEKMYDIFLLTKEPDRLEGYEKKKSSFIPAPLSEPLSGLGVEPINSRRMEMFVLYDPAHSAKVCQKIYSIL